MWFGCLTKFEVSESFVGNSCGTFESEVSVKLTMVHQGVKIR